MVSMEMERRRNARRAAFGIGGAAAGTMSPLHRNRSLLHHHYHHHSLVIRSPLAEKNKVSSISSDHRTNNKAKWKLGGKAVTTTTMWSRTTSLPSKTSKSGSLLSAPLMLSSSSTSSHPNRALLLGRWQQQRRRQRRGLLGGRGERIGGGDQPDPDSGAATVDEPFPLGDEMALRLEIECCRYVLDHQRPFNLMTHHDDKDALWGVPLVDVLQHVIQPTLLETHAAAMSSSSYQGSRRLGWGWWGRRMSSLPSLSGSRFDKQRQKQQDILERYQLLDAIDRLHTDVHRELLQQQQERWGGASLGGGDDGNEERVDKDGDVADDNWRRIVFREQGGFVTGWKQIKQFLIQGGYFGFPAPDGDGAVVDGGAADTVHHNRKDDPILQAYQRRLQQSAMEELEYDMLPSQRILLDIATRGGTNEYFDDLIQGEGDLKEGEGTDVVNDGDRDATTTATAAALLSMEQRLLEMTRDHELRVEMPSVKAVKDAIRNEEEAAQMAETLMRPLTADERKRIHVAMFGHHDDDDDHDEEVIGDDDIMAKEGSDTVSRSSLRKLLPRQWLNDEVIHFFYLMLAKRDAELCQQDPTRRRSHFFKSFFITKLLQEGHAHFDGVYDYKSVKRWSKHVPGKDIFALDKIFFPINVGRSHWVCAVVYMQEKKIVFHDSMGADGTEYMEYLLRYLQDEHMDKKKVPLPDVEEWELVPCDPRTTPQQMNGFDCGVFTCMFADFLSKDCPLVFDQAHITQCRERIALAILNGQAIV